MLQKFTGPHQPSLSLLATHWCTGSAWQWPVGVGGQLPGGLLRGGGRAGVVLPHRRSGAGRGRALPVRGRLPRGAGCRVGRAALSASTCFTCRSPDHDCLKRALNSTHHLFGGPALPAYHGIFYWQRLQTTNNAIYLRLYGSKTAPDAFDSIL